MSSNEYLHLTLTIFLPARTGPSRNMEQIIFHATEFCLMQTGPAVNTYTSLSGLFSGFRHASSFLGIVRSSSLFRGSIFFTIYRIPEVRKHMHGTGYNAKACPIARASSTVKNRVSGKFMA